MYDEFCIQQLKRADEHMSRFLEANPGCSLDRGHPQWLKGTHLVAFGQYGGKPAVYKYYDGDPRKEHERRALTLFEPTGLVPRIFSETDLMLVMERLPGSTLEEAQKNLNETECEQLYFQLGQAVANVVAAAPGKHAAPASETPSVAAAPCDFYSTPFDALSALYRQAGAAEFFDVTVMRAARALRDRDVPQKDTLGRSLRALEDSRDAILAYPSFVHMDDFHPNNVMADGPRITGFIDLEMTRYGNEVLLLGAAMSAMGRRPGRWAPFRRGYGHAHGAPMDESLLWLLRIAAPFSRWIRFTWYWSTDNLPWWAKETNLRLSAVREIAETIEAVEGMKS